MIAAARSPACSDPGKRPLLRYGNPPDRSGGLFADAIAGAQASASPSPCPRGGLMSHAA